MRAPQDATGRRVRLALAGAAVWAVLAVAFAVVAVRTSGDPATVTNPAGRTVAESSLLEPTDGPMPARPSPQQAGVAASGSMTTTPTRAAPTAAGGAQAVTVPDVLGLSKDEAGRRLANAGLRWDPHVVQAGEGAESGSVVGQQPAAGRQVAPDTVVKLQVAGESDGSGADPGSTPPDPGATTPTPSETPTPTPTPTPSATPTVTLSPAASTTAP